MGFPGGASGTEATCEGRRRKRRSFHPWVGKTPWRRAWQPTPVFLLGDSHGQEPGGLQSTGSQRVDTTERLTPGNAGGTTHIRGYELSFGGICWLQLLRAVSVEGICDAET